MKHLTLHLAARKPRNPLAGAARQRRAGRHGPLAGARRQRAGHALRRELAHLPTANSP